MDFVLDTISFYKKEILFGFGGFFSAGTGGLVTCRIANILLTVFKKRLKGIGFKR